MPRIVALFQRADEWQALLDRGTVANRAELAKYVGVSAGRVSQVLGLLKLHADIRAAIVERRPGISPRLLSERNVRKMAALADDEQLARFARIGGARRAG